jgi:leishmanolysin
MASITPPSPCVDYTPPSTTAFAGVDLVLFVLYITDQSQTYGATGKSCKYFEGTVTAGNPDLTLQIGRPTVGRIIFNTYNLVDRESSLTNRLFQSITSTALHETLHILGFDSTLYSSYLDPATGLHYSATTILGTVNSNRNATTFLTTPYVLAWAKDFFNCSSLTGMPL